MIYLGWYFAASYLVGKIIIAGLLIDRARLKRKLACALNRNAP